MKINELLKLSNSDISGKIIAFPTDTVYGVGALINDLVAVKKIYDMKHRDINKPLAILAPNIESILPYIEYPSLEVLDIMQKYWPGALTIIFNKNKENELLINSNLSTIAFRIPNSSIAGEILNHFGLIATTSVNISGNAPLNNFEDINEKFNDYIDYIIESDENSSNVSSTIIDATTYPYVILREGDIKIN